MEGLLEPELRVDICDGGRGGRRDIGEQFFGESCRLNHGGDGVDQGDLVLGVGRRDCSVVSELSGSTPP